MPAKQQSTISKFFEKIPAPAKKGTSILIYFSSSAFL